MNGELVDKSPSGRKRPWKEKKASSLSIAGSYHRLGEHKRSRTMAQCGNMLQFRRYADGSLKLAKAMFCKSRLCPMCGWRRSLKIFGQLQAVVDEAVWEGGYGFLFLTLTVRNCEGEELPFVIDGLMDGAKRYFRMPRIKKAVSGYFRALEVTRNANRDSKDFDTFHPHVHCILMVRKSYFKGGDYISQEEWRSMWEKSMDLDYLAQVHIERIRGETLSRTDLAGLRGRRLSSIVAEAAKYTVKDADILDPDEGMQDRTVAILDRSLAHRRLVSFGGKFKEIHKRLNLDDAVDGDLMDTGGHSDAVGDYELITYIWSHGFWNYVRAELTGGICPAP